jgi:hypothetical protein
VGVVGLGQLFAELNSLGILYQMLFILTLATSIVIPIRTFPRNESSQTVNYDARRWSLAQAWNFQGA